MQWVVFLFATIGGLVDDFDTFLDDNIYWLALAGGLVFILFNAVFEKKVKGINQKKSEEYNSIENWRKSSKAKLANALIVFYLVFFTPLCYMWLAFLQSL